MFVDTNLWVYRLDQREPEKSTFIRDWLRAVGAEHEIVVSTQVLIELRSVLTRKLLPSLSPADTRLALEIVSAFEVVPTHAAMVLDAHELAESEQLSWFDALIVEAALRSQCGVLYSEDLDHGRRVGALTVCNPFMETSGVAK